MKTRLLIILAISFVLILSVPLLAVSQEVEPPLKQIKYTHPTNVICNDNLVLRFKYDNKPVCMDLFSIIALEKRNRDFFTLFNMDEFQVIGSWNPNLGKPLDYDSSTFYTNDQPRPSVGTMFWQDEKSEFEIKYQIINGNILSMMATNILQDPSDRHTWPINIVYRGDENTILIFELPDDLELENAVGMHMEQLQRQNILFQFADSDGKSKRQIILSDIPPEKEDIIFIEMAFLNHGHKYDVIEIPMPAAKKYLSENFVSLENVPKAYCELKGGTYHNNQCLFESSSSSYVCDAWDFYITSQCKPSFGEKENECSKPFKCR
jgi:hypothetical protein